MECWLLFNQFVTNIIFSGAEKLYLFINEFVSTSKLDKFSNFHFCNISVLWFYGICNSMGLFQVCYLYIL